MSKHKFCEIGEAILNEDLPRLEAFILNGKIKHNTRIHDMSSFNGGIVVKFKLPSVDPMHLFILNFVARYGTLKVLQFFLDHVFIEKKQDYDVICSFCFRFAFPEIYEDFDNNLQMLRFLVQKGFTTNWMSLFFLSNEYKFLRMSHASLALETIYLVLIAAESVPERIPHIFYNYYRTPLKYFAFTFDDVVVEWPMILYSYCFQYKNTNPHFYLQHVTLFCCNYCTTFIF